MEEAVFAVEKAVQHLCSIKEPALPQLMARPSPFVDVRGCVCSQYEFGSLLLQDEVLFGPTEDVFVVVYLNNLGFWKFK